MVMNTTRLPKLVIAVSLILVAIFADTAFQSNNKASASNNIARLTGYGDLGVYEAKPVTIEIENDSQFQSNFANNAPITPE